MSDKLMKKHESKSLYTKDPLRKIKDGISYGVIGFSTALTVGVLLFIIGFIFVTGAPRINLHFLTSAFDDMIDYTYVTPLKEYDINKLEVTLKVTTHDGHHYLAIDEIGSNSPLKNVKIQEVKGEGAKAQLIMSDFKIKDNYIIEQVGKVNLAENTIDTLKDQVKEVEAFVELEEVIDESKARVTEINQESKMAKDTIALAEEIIRAKSEGDINAIEVSKEAVIELLNSDNSGFSISLTHENYMKNIDIIVEELKSKKNEAELRIIENEKEYKSVMSEKNLAIKEQEKVIEQFYIDHTGEILAEAYEIINANTDESLKLKIVQPGGGIVPMLVTTLYMIGLALLISGPIGIFAAIYLVEYAKPGLLVRVIRFGTESLAGIPSIIYGLFGALFFVTILKLGISLISGALTVSIILLPVIIRQTEESLKAVPMSFREGSLGLGATKIQTIIKVVLPSAVPGILVAIILSVGRVVGESAAILLTAGTTARIPKTIGESGATLTIKAYQVAKEEGNIEMACAIGTVIIVLVVLINLSSKYISTRFMNMNN